MRVSEFMTNVPENAVYLDALKRVDFHLEGKRMIAICSTSAEAAFIEMIAKQNIIESLKMKLDKPFNFEIIRLDGADGFIATQDYTNLLGTGRVKPENTFDNFIAGEANKEALHDAIKLSGMHGATERNRFLYIYGGVGLGKTHLLHATIDRLLQNGMKVAYFNGSEFVDYIIHALANKGRDYTEYMEIFNKADVLAIDDVTYLKSSKMKTTAKELKSLLDRYMDRGKFGLFTGEKYPTTANWDATEALSSRFLTGFVAEVLPPDVTLRRLLIQHKFELLGKTIDEELINFIGDAVFDDIRALLQFCQRLNDGSEHGEGALSIIAAQKLLKKLKISSIPAYDAIVSKAMQELGLINFPLVELQGKGLDNDLREIRKETIQELFRKKPLKKYEIAKAFRITPQFVGRILKDSK